MSHRTVAPVEQVSLRPTMDDLLVRSLDHGHRVVTDWCKSPLFRDNPGL